MGERNSTYDRDPFAVRVADRIRQLLDEKQVSQIDLASAIGRSPAFVWRILDARQNVTLSVLGSICLALDATPSELFAGVTVPDGAGLPRTHASPAKARPSHDEGDAGATEARRAKPKRHSASSAARAASKAIK